MKHVLPFLFLSACHVNPDNSVQVGQYNVSMSSSGCSESLFGLFIIVVLILSAAASIKILFFNK